MKIEPNKIPPEMASRKAWACSFLDADGTLNKRPMMTKTKPAGSTDVSTWQNALDLVPHEPARYGFMLSVNDPYVVIDLDAPKNSTEAEQEAFQSFALGVIAKFDSYTEVSNSGKGYHIFIKGSLAACGERCRTGNVEMYESGRYLIVTGDKLEGAPQEPQDRQDALAAFYAATFPAEVAERPEMVVTGTHQASEEEILDIIERPCFFKTKAAYDGQSSKGNTGSELDGELCMYLAFFTRDPEVIYNLWNESPCARDSVRKKGKKWFLAQNVASALRVQRDSFDWQPREEQDSHTCEEAKQYFHFKMEETAQAVDKAKIDDSAFFEAVASQNEGLPHGVTGALARHFLDGALYPDDQFAIASALGVVSTIASRSYYFDQGQSPNVYMIAIGGSGSGKDNITKDITRVLGAVDKNTNMRFLARLCQTMPASKEGVTTALADRGIGSVTFLKSEMDKYLAKANKNETSKQKEITDEILELYSQSNAEFIKFPPPRANKENHAPPVHAPCVTLVGEGTKEVLFDNLDTDALTGGFVSRLLLIERGSEERKVNTTLRDVKTLQNNRKFYEQNGQTAEARECEGKLDQYKYVGADGRMIIPDSVISSLSLLSRKVLELCEYTTNFGVGEDTLEVMGLVAGEERACTTRPSPMQVLFHPDSMSYIDGEDDKVNRKMKSEGSERGAAWSRTVLKAKKVACLLAIVDNPACPIIGLREIKWSYKWVCRQSRMLADSIDKGEVGGGESAKQLKQLKDALTKHIAAGGGKCRPWISDIGRGMLDANMLSRSMILKVACNLYTFRQLTASQRKSSMDNCIELLTSDGFFIQLERDARGEGTGVCFAFSPDLKEK
jgi:putative DNA primase/helicase